MTDEGLTEQEQRDLEASENGEGELMDLILEFERTVADKLEHVPNSTFESVIDHYKGKDGSLAANMWATATMVLLHRRLSALGKLLPNGTTMMSLHELMLLEERTKGSS